MTTHIFDNLAKNLAIHRKHRNLSQNQLAKLVGCKPAEIRCLESATCTPNLIAILRLCEEFNVTVDNFLFFPSHDHSSYCDIATCPLYWRMTMISKCLSTEESVSIGHTVTKVFDLLLVTDEYRRGENKNILNLFLDHMKSVTVNEKMGKVVDFRRKRTT